MTAREAVGVWWPLIEAELGIPSTIFVGGMQPCFEWCYYRMGVRTLVNLQVRVDVNATDYGPRRWQISACYTETHSENASGPWDGLPISQLPEAMTSIGQRWIANAERLREGESWGETLDPIPPANLTATQ